jgi:hypothetical protein
MQGVELDTSKFDTHFIKTQSNAVVLSHFPFFYGRKDVRNKGEYYISGYYAYSPADVTDVSQEHTTIFREKE